MEITTEDIRQANIAESYEMALEAISGCETTLDFAMKALESGMTEAELAEDKRYSALYGVYEGMREAIEVFTPKDHSDGNEKE